MKNLTQVQDGDTVDYKTLKAGDVTPDGMTFVAIYEDEETGKQKALLRTEFNVMCHYSALALAKRVPDRRLPTMNELIIIQGAMNEKQINRLHYTFAWSNNYSTKGLNFYECQRVPEYSLVVNLRDGKPGKINGAIHGQACFVQSVDL